MILVVVAIILSMLLVLLSSSIHDPYCYIEYEIGVISVPKQANFLLSIWILGIMNNIFQNV